MRLIDADALIKKAYDEAKGMAKPYDDFGTLVEWLVDKSPTIEPEPHWIPCSERLPEDDVQVLCTDSEGFVYIAWHCDYDIIEKTKCWCDVHYLSLSEDDIIAWMPLPEPYRGEGDNK